MNIIMLKDLFGDKTFKIEDLTCELTRKGIKAYNKDDVEVKVMCFTTNLYCSDKDDE